MGTFLRVIGLASAALTLAWALVSLTTVGANYVISLLPWIVPGIVSSIVLAGFGTIVTEVQDVRRAADRQTDLLIQIKDKLSK